MKYVKGHWLIVLILLLSSLTGAFFNFQKLSDLIFSQETAFAGRICAEREPFAECDELNTAALDFLYSSSGTGVVYQTNLIYEVREGLDDPCKPHRYLLDDFSPYFNAEQKTYVFHVLRGNTFPMTDLGECTDRLYGIKVSSEFVAVNESSFDRQEQDYIIVGNFLISQRNDIRGITEFHLLPR